MRPLQGCSSLLLLVTSAFTVVSAEQKPTRSPATEQTQTLSLAFDNVPVQNILRALADHQRLNLVVAPGVEGEMSLRLDEVPWQQALNVVLRMGGLEMEREGNVLLISSKVTQQAGSHVLEPQVPLPVEDLLFTVQYADVAEVVSSLQAQRGTLLTDQGTVSMDKRTNTLLIRDTAPALQQLKSWLSALDRPLAQVQLAAHIVTISSESLRALGVSWGLSGNPDTGNALRINDFTVNLPVESPAGSIGFSLARFNGRLLDLELTALEQENEVEIIASPRLFTAHQQMASIKQGTEIPYQVSNGNNGSTSIEFKEAVLGMEVTPRVLHDGKITLNLKISQNVPGISIKQSNSGEALTIDKQEIQTQVTVANGETIALGGIFQQHRTQGGRKVPGLSDIPLLGALFKNSKNEQRRRELVIFITPTLISERQ